MSLRNSLFCPLHVLWFFCLRLSNEMFGGMWLLSWPNLVKQHHSLRQTGTPSCSKIHSNGCNICLLGWKWFIRNECAKWRSLHWSKATQVIILEFKSCSEHLKQDFQWFVRTCFSTSRAQRVGNFDRRRVFWLDFLRTTLSSS